MDITDPAIAAYVDAHTTPPPARLEELEAETRASLDSPQMLTGRLEGRLLETLVWITGARRVLEIGTYSGYSALSMAAALPPDGRLVTCEVDPDRVAFARRHLDASPYGDRVEIRLGPALETVQGLDGPWDLVFVDADKRGYPAYVDAVLPKLAERGLIVLDNTLQDGTVLDPTREQPKLVDELNTRLAGDPALIVTLLPIRDGVTLVRRAA
jgi:caffeoyl-CoA O-methyltransferase